MAIKIGKLLKGALGIATSVIPGGGVVKGLLGLVAKQIPGAEETLAVVFNETEKLYEERADIRRAYLEEQKARNEFLLESEGRYTDLKTKAERFVKTFTRPLLTIGCVTNLIIMIWKKVEIDPVFLGICTALVISWCGTKAIRDWRNGT